MLFRLGIGVLAASVWAAAQPIDTVNALIVLVRAEMAQGRTDSQVAKAIHKFKLAESLDEQALEELESEGAGRKTLDELIKLRDESANLPKPAEPEPFVHPAKPPIEEQRRMLKEARDLALNYARSLPNFFCNEVVKRYLGRKDGWDLRDTLELKLTYFDQKEDYKLLMINGRPTARSFREVGGATSEGEFGTVLQQVFDPRSAAEFRWDHWTTLRKRPAHVLSFRIAPSHSLYHITYGYGGEHDTTVVGQHGMVYVDAETSEILRIWAEADNIPADFPVYSSTMMLDYEITDIKGRKFLVPLRAEVRMESTTSKTRNEVQFRDYRKFGAEASISFDAK